MRIKNFFKFKDLKTTLKAELIGGLTTFLAVVYILGVEPNILHDASSFYDLNARMSKGGIFISTIIVMFIGTIIMCLISNMPVLIGPGMGINAVFTYNVASTGLGYEGALISVMISSILLTIISCTKAREIIVKAIPTSMKFAIGTGIGMFVAYLGIKGINLVPNNNGVPIASLSKFNQTYPSILLGVLVLGLTYFLHFKKVPGGMVISLLTGMVIAALFANLMSSNSIVNTPNNYVAAKWHGWEYGDFNGFVTNLKSTYKAFAEKEIWASPTLYISMFIFLFVCFFDATGAIYSISEQISQQSGVKYELNKKALLADVLAGIPAGFLGVSATTTVIESTAGISQGARTGVAGIFAAILLSCGVALYPIFSMIPSCVSSASLIFVGSLMVRQIKSIEWSKPEFAISSFFGILGMIVTFSITNGIALCFVSYVFISLITKKAKLVHPAMYIVSICFVGYFVLQAFI